MFVITYLQSSSVAYNDNNNYYYLLCNTECFLKVVCNKEAC